MKPLRNLCLPAFLFCILFSLMSSIAFSRTVEIPFNPANFASPPATITNQYWPLLEGNSFVYKAVAEDECEFNKMTVTSVIYTVEAGIETRVVRDQEWITEVDESGDCDISTAELVEDTLDYYAQDTSGNIWYGGENTWAWDDEIEECTQEGSWEAGLPVGDPEVDPAKAGIIMLANPLPGLRYQQEYLEDVAEDWGAVLRLNASVSLELGEYGNCLVTKEWTPLEPGEVEHKYYCLDPTVNGGGSGLVFIEELKGKSLYVEFIGNALPGVFPGDGDGTFPSAALGCS